MRLRKEAVKEVGKFLYDVSKIIIALAIIGKIVKNETISYLAMFIVFLLLVVGTLLINEGVKDE